MTKEQEEAIEYLKKHIKYFEEQIKFIEATDCDYYDEELELYQNRVKQFNIVLSMLKEKDKQIDLMANHIATSDSDLCEYLDITTKCKYYAGDNGKTCDNCIKQYFENKAKELLNK